MRRVQQLIRPATGAVEDKDDIGKGNMQSTRIVGLAAGPNSSSLTSRLQDLVNFGPSTGPCFVSGPASYRESPSTGCRIQEGCPLADFEAALRALLLAKVPGRFRFERRRLHAI